MKPTFSHQKQEWSSPPVDDIGYLPSVDLLNMEDDVLRTLIERMENNRYNGWRNWNGNWRRLLGLDTTKDKVVLDYGCGVGLEALQYAKHNNTVLLADIAETNVFLATRVLHLYGYEPGAAIILQARSPFADLAPETIDIVHCNGVLHHIPKPVPVVQQFAYWLRPGGELRLMVYSDRAWITATGTYPPTKVEDDPWFDTYVRYWDAVGNYADWYDQDRIEDRFGKWFSCESCEPLTEDGSYIAATLRKK